MQVNTLVKIVSLDDAHARRAAMRNRLLQADLAWEFFDAHRGLAGGLAYQERDAWIAKGRPLVRQELGCYSSHYGIWQALLASDANQVLVLEDDVVGDWSYVRSLLPMDFADVGIHLLRLFGKYPSGVRQRGRLGKTRVFRFTGFVEGTQAYILTRHGAETLLRHCQRVCRPIDDAMDRSWVHGIAAFGLLPYPIVELNVPSQIPGRDGVSESNPYRWRWIAHKLGDRARRLAHEMAQPRGSQKQIHPPTRGAAAPRHAVAPLHTSPC